MGWEDTIYDTKAKLEEAEPSDVRDMLESYLEGAEDDWYPEWKNKWLGIRMYHYVMDSHFEDYTSTVGTLQEAIEEAANELLGAIEAGEGWKANEAQSAMASWFDSAEVKWLRLTASGEIPSISSNRFEPTKYRTWIVTGVDATFQSEPQGYINEDAYLVSFHTKDTATGDTKTHEAKHVLDLDALFDEDDFRAPFRFSKRESLKGFETDPDSIETRFTDEPGNVHVTASATLPIRFDFEGSEEDYEVEANLIAEGWFHPSTGEVDFVSFRVRTY